jgi:hypothetical protein
MITNEMQQAMDATDGEWKNVSEEGVKEFQKILDVLNRYYSQLGKKSETQSYREMVANASPDEVKLSLKKFGEFEYLIKCEVGEKSDSWIHIDGIAEERKEMASRNNWDHPVFNIVCLSDIYSK